MGLDYPFLFITRLHLILQYSGSVFPCTLLQEYILFLWLILEGDLHNSDAFLLYCQNVYIFVYWMFSSVMWTQEVSVIVLLHMVVIVIV